MITFSEWAKLEETKTAKKAKIAPVAHTDIDRWLKSVDGLAKDLMSLKQAKDKSQTKLDQIKKKYEPAEKPAEDKPSVEKPAVEKLTKQKDEKEPDSKPVKMKLKPEELNDDDDKNIQRKRLLDVKPKRIIRRVPVADTKTQQDSLE